MEEKKSSKKIIFIIILVLLIFISVPFILFFSIKKDQRATKERIEEIATVYHKFSEEVDKFNDIRNDLYLNVFDNIYYETLAQEDASVQEKLSNYEVIVDEVYKVTSQLKSLCGNIRFTDSSTKNKCDTYASVYEQIANAFVTDVNTYNKNIDGYNEYQQELNTGLSLERYVTSKNFVDYNNDKKYEGKEE